MVILRALVIHAQSSDVSNRGDTYLILPWNISTGGKLLLVGLMLHSRSISHFPRENQYVHKEMQDQCFYSLERTAYVIDCHL